MNSVPLTQAVTSGDADAVSAVLANGADVNERTGGGQTPLILATIFGHAHLIPLLLDAGADPHLRDNLGLNAIDWAQRRGATEVIDVLTNKADRKAGPRIDTRPQAPLVKSPSPIEPEADRPKTISQEERSQRWLAGLKQRIAEQSQGEVSEGPNIFGQRPEPTVVEILPSEPEPEPAPEPELEPEPEPQIPQFEQIEPAQAETPTENPRPKSAKRKRCPKCNAIYNSDLLAYCAHHIVPLVDADEPPVISEPPRQSPVLFWMIIVITLTGSLVVGSVIASYFWNANKVPPQTAASPPPPNAVQKGLPLVDPELEGKVVSLPIAECPLNGQEAIPGTVVVRVVIDRNGQVTSARASGGDWLLRDAATKAAMKSTFWPEKLRRRETEGTISYTFEP